MRVTEVVDLREGSSQRNSNHGVFFTKLVMAAMLASARAMRLKYFDGTPVIKELKRVSTPGRRVYAGVKDIPSVRQGLGIAIVSTPSGVMSDSAARTANIGGEVLCTVF